MIQSLAEGGRSKKRSNLLILGGRTWDVESSRERLRFISSSQMASSNITKLMSSVQVEITDKCAAFINGRWNVT